ncbi:MAG: alpha/beta hydrolase [Candidatus Dormibacteraeota bacterium]|nr:alpha/beta hydrolase [Candidatus Dormibacteraeota bacterium]
MSAVALETGEVHFGGLRLHHTFGGAGGTPLVLVHGLGSSGYLEWRRNLPFFAARGQVFAPDLPGFGRSQKGELPYGLGLFVQVLDAYVEALGLGRIDLVGTSLGGRIAMELALSRPGLVARLGLVNALGIGSPPFRPYYPLVALPRVGEAMLRSLRGLLRTRSVEEVRRFYERAPGSSPSTAEAIDEAYVTALREVHDEVGYHAAYLATVRSLARPAASRAFDQTARLAASGLPLLLVWGALDTLFPLPLARAAAANIPGAQLAVIENAGHTPQAERPDEFNRAVTEFLDAG